MTTQQIDALENLQRCWTLHQELRESGAALAELANSRRCLDAARFEAARLTNKLAA